MVLSLIIACKSFHLLSDQERSCRTCNLVGVDHECLVNLHHPQPLMPVRVRKDRWIVGSYLPRSVNKLILFFQVLPKRTQYWLSLCRQIQAAGLYLPKEWHSWHGWLSKWFLFLVSKNYFSLLSRIECQSDVMVWQTLLLKPELLPSPVLVLCLLFLPQCRPSVPCVDSRIHDLSKLEQICGCWTNRHVELILLKKCI